EGVVVAFAAFGKAGETFVLAHAGHALAPAGQDLVRIGLMADTPYQAIVGRVVEVMQRNGELDDAEPGAEVAASLAHGVEQKRAQLLGELRQRRLVQTAQVRRVFDPVEQRCMRALPGDFVEHRSDWQPVKKGCNCKPTSARWPAAQIGRTSGRASGWSAAVVESWDSVAR